MARKEKAISEGARMNRTKMRECTKCKKLCFSYMFTSHNTVYSTCQKCRNAEVRKCCDGVFDDDSTGNVAMRAVMKREADKRQALIEEEVRS